MKKSVSVSPDVFVAFRVKPAIKKELRLLCMKKGVSMKHLLSGFVYLLLEYSPDMKKSVALKKFFDKALELKNVG